MAMQRMNDAAQMQDMPPSSMAAIHEEEETKHDPSSSKGEGRVSQLLKDIVAPPTIVDGGSGDTLNLKRGYQRQSSAGVAPNGLRFSALEKTAQDFMWDDGSLASGTSRVSGEFNVLECAYIII